MKIKTFIAIIVFILCHTLAASETQSTIRIGSKRDTENHLLAEIMAKMIEHHSEYKVERFYNLGGTTVTFQALKSGQIDLYPEATGTAWHVLLQLGQGDNDPLATYTTVKQALQNEFELIALDPYGFSNSYALAVHEDTAQQYHLKSLTDLENHSSQLVAGFTHEFMNRKDGLMPLMSHYHFKFKDIFGLEHGLAYQALINRRADVIEAWSTDGKLAKYPIVLLRDDKHYFPPYHAFPLVSKQALNAFPELEKIINRLNFKISNQAMQKLNLLVEEAQTPIERIAYDFLVKENLIGNQHLPPTTDTLNQKYWHELPGYILEHLRLSFFGILFAIIIGVPLGILIAQKAFLRPPLLTFIGIIQTIPSLALLALFISVPGLGLGTRSAIMALFLYALLPIVRSTYTGIQEIEPALIETALGLGLKPLQILTKIKIPLVVRPIMSGIRTATVISIGVATLAAFIGAGGLGEPILTGLQLNNSALILLGAIPAALLAIIADGFLNLVEYLLIPKGLQLQEKHYEQMAKTK